MIARLPASDIVGSGPAQVANRIHGPAVAGSTLYSRDAVTFHEALASNLVQEDFVTNLLAVHHADAVWGRPESIGGDGT